MRRFITITTVLLSFIGCMRLTGQNIPMLVAGKVHVSGPLYSQGAIHVDTITVDTAMIDIDNGIGNATAILAADTVILYSNDTFEGLLRNLNSNADGGVGGIIPSGSPAGTQPNAQPSRVIVRKFFMPDVYTYFSIPFAVTSDNVLEGYTNNKLSRGVVGTKTPGNYYVSGFDAEARSTNQGFVTSSGVWKDMEPTDSLYASMGYQLWYDSDGPAVGGVVDFVTVDQAAIQNLFAYEPKAVEYTLYRTYNYNNPIQENMDAGWAFIGGTNSTVFRFLQNNVKYYDGGTIYYRDTKDSKSTGTQTHTEYTEFTLGLDEGSASIAIPQVGPYTPFYIQQSVGTDGTTARGLSSLAFNPSGLLLDDITFRSSNDEAGAQDRLYFALTSDNDNSFDRFYLNFDKNYSESYKAIEDAVKMSTAFSARPAVWSLLDGANAALVVSGLPMVDNRKVQMGFSVPKAGDYTISLSPQRNQDVRNVILVDNTTGKKVDLLQEGSYSFSTGAVEGENGRFVLYINSAYTGTPIVSTNDPYAYAKDNVLTVKNLAEGDRVQVLDLAGRTIATGTVSGNEFSVVVGQKGVYVVNVKGEKTSVLKVLNK